MDKRSSIVGGVILIVAGGFMLLLQLFPGLATQLNVEEQWPLIIIGLGVLFLISGLVALPPLVIPGSIITGVGAILYYQNLTGNWESWAYVWTLIPGFVGIGIMLMSLLTPSERKGWRDGAKLVLISAALFVVFGAGFGVLGGVGRLWPLLLIVLGGWILFRDRRGRAAELEGPAKAEKDNHVQL
jgi:hypothetical protein